MNSKLVKLSLFELKKNLFHSRNWVYNLFFLLINMSIVPFTINPNSESLNLIFLSVIMTSMLLGIVLVSNHIFDEDLADGSFDQYQMFGLPMFAIYLSKVIAVSCEFALIITIIFPCMALLYAIPLLVMFKILLIMICCVPLLTSVSVFGALLTANIKKNTAISILLIFPLLISILIILSLAAGKILTTGDFISALPFVEINIGITIILLPVLCVLVKYLR